MKKDYHAIIIGCGIIGNCIAFELAKKGYRTLSLDRLAGSGFGSTGASCAIVRAHYSTRDSVAFAYEGVHIWKNWADYCEVRDPDGMAVYRMVGSIMLKSRDRDWQRIIRLYDELGVEYEEWGPEETRARMPIMDLHEFWPPARPEEDEHFFDERDTLIPGAIWAPEAGYMSDPKLTAHNVQAAARARGAAFRFNSEVTAVRQEDGRVLGVTLAGGTEINAPVVVNVAGAARST